MVSGCSFSLITSEPEPVVIHEPNIESLEFEPVILPSTALPTSTFEQAKDSYIYLLNSTKTKALKAEALQRLAEIESMIAENMLDKGLSEEMNAHLKLSAGYYQQLLDNYSTEIDISKTQYQLARILELDGETILSQQLLGDLAGLKGEEFEVIEAGFRMAEAAYSQKNYSNALTLYNKVLKHKNDPENGQLNSFYNTALFKRGWTQFKKQNYDYAVDDFIELLKIIYVTPALRNTGQDTLIKETYRVAALSLSYMNGAESLSGYFPEGNHAPFEAELYLALADLYQQQQRFQDTANTYQVFVQHNPLSAYAPEFEHKGIEVLSKAGFVDLILKAKEHFVERYQSDADYWQLSSFERSTNVSEWLFKNLDDVINYHHAQAQQTKKIDDYNAAAKWYRIFIQSFSEHPKVNDKRWLLAETLTDAGNNVEAITEYQILAYQKNNLTAEKKEEAGFRIILARQNLFNELTASKTTEINIINLARTELIDAGLAYKASFIGSKRAPDVIAQTIELLLGAEQTAEAITLARTMKETKWATKENLKRSREIIANGEFDLKNYMLAEKAFSLIFEHDHYTTSKMKIFHERRAQSIYKQAEFFKKDEQYQQAVKQFLRVAEVEPESKIRMNADFDAATLLLQIENYKRAIIVLESFVNNFPNSSLAKNIPAKLIVAYEAVTDWKGAATQYELIASSATDTKIARTATWQAATTWMKLTDKESKNTSVMLWKKYIKAYPQPFDLSLEARNNLINLYGELNIKWKQDFWRNKIIATVDNNKLKNVRAKSLAATSQLSLSTDVFNEFRAVKLTQPLKKSLKKKRAKLKSSLSGFSKVLDYRIQGVSTQAGFRIGQLYAILAQSILDSERPKGMSELELEEYETLLEERVYPFEDDAIESLEANVSLTQQAVWDEWIERSFQQLEILMPARYKKPEVIDDYATTP